MKKLFIVLFLMFFVFIGRSFAECDYQLAPCSVECRPDLTEEKRKECLDFFNKLEIEMKRDSILWDVKFYMNRGETDRAVERINDLLEFDQRQRMNSLYPMEKLYPGVE